MDSLFARTAHTVSRSGSSAVAGICRTVGASFSSRVLQYRSYAGEGLDGRVPPSPEASSSAHLLGSKPLSRTFAPIVAKCQTFATDTLVYFTNAYPRRKWEGFRVGVPIAILKLSEDKSPVGSCLRAYSVVAPKSCHEFSRQGFIHGEDRQIGSAYAAGNMQVSKAVAILQHRQQQGITIDSYTFVDVLKLCSNRKDLRAARQLHNCIIQSGMDKNPYVANTLLNAYVRCGRLQDARLLFDGLEKKDHCTWAIMIGGYAKNSHPQDAREVFNQMRQEGVEPGELLCLSMLNACANPVALKWGKEIHAYIRHAGFESDTRVGTALVQMYASCGCIMEAKLLFEKLSNRDVITWNAMIGAYAKNGFGLEAYRVFLQMQGEGFRPNAVTYMSILNTSASAGALEWVTEVHGHARTAGLESDLRVGSALVQMYSKSGSIVDARLIFDRLKARDVRSWSVMIGAYAQNGRGAEAYKLFLEMQREGFKPDGHTYAGILNPSASVGALEWVSKVHSHAVKAGLESDLRVGNALVHMYAKCDRIGDARGVFDRLKTRDVTTWTIMIGAYAEIGCGEEAYRLFLHMNREGLIPDVVTYVSILNASASAGAFEWVKQVHDHARRAGLESDLRVGGALVHMYGKCGHVGNARVVFDRLKTRDVRTWNVMIGAYAESSRGLEAYRLFLQMQLEGQKPNAYTYTSILSTSGSIEALEWVKDVHRQALVAGLASDVRVGTALVQMYASCGCIRDAARVFEELTCRDIVTWNAMVGAYAKSGFGVEAYRVFVQMQQEGFKPNAITYISMLNGCASAGALEWVKEVHGHARRAGLESDLRVGNALVHMYAKSGSLDDAQLVFNSMEQRDVLTWNAMIGGLAQHGRGHKALELFSKMTVDGVKPSETSFVAVLSACCHAGLVDDGHRLFSAMTEDYGMEPTVVHYTCMVDLLGRAGLLEEAKLFIDNMPVEPNAVTWKALLGACRTYGNVKLGEVAATQVLKLDPKDAAPYVVLSNIYAAAGKWEKVWSVRKLMQKRGVWKEPGCSWIEVDNKIHEFFVGDTSHPEAKAIYNVLEELTEKLKAEGYSPDTKLVLQDMNEEDKELALCSHSERLAIAYGLLQIPVEQPIRVYKNLRVCSDCHTATKLISKVTGREIIARDANRFHHFKDGVCSCGDYW